jgi:hypothetical protein
VIDRRQVEDDSEAANLAAAVLKKVLSIAMLTPEKDKGSSFFIVVKRKDKDPKDTK